VRQGGALEAHEKFCAAIAQYDEAYEVIAFSYLAARQGSEIHLIQSRLDFIVTKSMAAPESIFESRNVLAGHCILTAKERNYTEFLKGISLGKVTFRGLEMNMLSGVANGVRQNVRYIESDRAHRRMVFSIQAGPAPSIAARYDLDWEVRAAPRPFDGLVDVAMAHGLNPQSLDIVTFEASAAHLAEIDPNSIVSGTDAQPSCFLASRIAPERLQLNYRVQHRGQIIERGSLAGTSLEWEQQERAARGTGKIVIPEGAVVQCFPVVDGSAQHRYWLADNKSLPNAYRAAFEGYDKDLALLKDFLADTPRKGRDARDLEFGMSWLLWMLGFSPAHFGANPRTQEAPDLLVATPSANFLVVECTIGLLKAENKLAKLHERTTNLRTRLAASGQAHLRVVPMIVTPLTREDVKADIDQAERLGMVVATRETIEVALNRTIVPQNPESLFADLEKEIEEGKRRQAIGNNGGPTGIS
jgi:hypothetical protein